MKHYPNRLISLLFVFVIIATACQTINNLPFTEPTPGQTTEATLTPLPANPIGLAEVSENEPVFIIGDIPYTSPFFLNTTSEPFVLLEDQEGFILRDNEHPFKLESQVIGPVEIHDDLSLSYGLALPSVPQGAFFDLDNDKIQDRGVQVFAVAYWSNTWGGPYLEQRDGTGWSTAYASTITDPDNDGEIIGGLLVVWAPDDEQGFPTSFGEDGLLFTEDDPTDTIPAGYSLIDLNETPFLVYKETRPHITLIEGDVAVNDFKDLSYVDAFDALFRKATREYPFTEDKRIDWQVLFDQYAPKIAEANSPEDFYRALRDFTYEIPDSHVGLSLNPDVFFEEQGGSFGMLLTELSDGRVIVTDVLPSTASDEAGIQVGAEILSWGNQSISEAISDVMPYFGPYSTEHTKRIDQVTFLTRVAPGARLEVGFSNPGDSEIQHVNLTAEVEYTTLFMSIPALNEDELSLPIQGHVLDSSQLGYISINTFDDDYHLMAQLWESHIQALIDSEIPGLIIDMRTNSGGSSGLAYDFAGYFFDEEIILYNSAYYNDQTGEFEYTDYPAKIKPAPLLYEGPIAVLVSPDCVSACEGFTYALTQQGRSIVIGHYPSSGAFGEVGRGQYELPEELSMQFPTGRPETPDGDLLIEGIGVTPDIIVLVTEDSALGIIDAVLNAAEQALLNMIN